MDLHMNKTMTLKQNECSFCHHNALHLRYRQNFHIFAWCNYCLCFHFKNNRWGDGDAICKVYRPIFQVWVFLFLLLFEHFQNACAIFSPSVGIPFPFLLFLVWAWQASICRPWEPVKRDPFQAAGLKVVGRNNSCQDAGMRTPPGM